MGSWQLEKWSHHACHGIFKNTGETEISKQNPKLHKLDWHKVTLKFKQWWSTIPKISTIFNYCTHKRPQQNTLKFQNVR